MSDNVPVFRLQGIVLFIILSMFLVLILVFLFLGVTESAFEEIGFTRAEFAVILVTTFLGSSINIPITRVRGTNLWWDIAKYDTTVLLTEFPSLSVLGLPHWLRSMLEVHWFLYSSRLIFYSLARLWRVIPP